jgi:hypothetical protein
MLVSPFSIKITAWFQHTEVMYDFSMFRKRFVDYHRHHYCLYAFVKCNIFMTILLIIWQRLEMDICNQVDSIIMNNCSGDRNLVPHACP